MAGDTTTKTNGNFACLGPVVNREGLAAALGLSEPTVNRRVGEGMPCLQKGSRGRAWQFDLAACVAWDRERAIKKAVGHVEDGETKAALERRLLVARVTKEEIDAAKAAGLVAPVDEIERALSAAFVEVRQGMLAPPPCPPPPPRTPRLALRVMAADDETEIKDLMREEIDLVLSQLSDADLLEGMDDTD